MTPRPLSSFRRVGDQLYTASFSLPSVLEDALGESAYTEYEKRRRDQYANNPYLTAELQNSVVHHTSAFDTFLFDQTLRNEVQGAPRTPLLRDLRDPRILEMVRGKHYLDTRSVVVRSLNDSYNSRNDSLIRTLVEQGDIDVARLAREPVMLSGLDLELAQEDRTGYGLRLVPNKEFNTEYDDRFLAKWSGTRFDETDEKGIPIFKDNGSRIWYTREDGLSGLFLDRDVYLCSNWCLLDDSYSDGRVVVVGGEATSQKGSESTQEQ